MNRYDRRGGWDWRSIAKNSDKFRVVCIFAVLMALLPVAIAWLLLGRSTASTIFIFASPVLALALCGLLLENIIWPLQNRRRERKRQNREEE